MGIGIVNKEQLCLDCGYVCCNRRSLGNHLMRSHKRQGGQREYVLRHFLENVIPKCNCKCGQDVEWHKTLYRFNDFVTGHNKSNLIGFKHSQEQVDKRNNAIRDAYKENAVEFSKKIGDAVHEAFKDPKKNENLRTGQRRGWKDPERKKRLALRNVDMLAKGLIGPRAPFKVEWKHNPFTGKDEWMHSGWESAFLDRCIALGCPVTKDHGITIPYAQLDGTEHIYLPDFKMIDIDVLFEVKGRMTDNDELKLRAAAALGYEVVLVRDT